MSLSDVEMLHNNKQSKPVNHLAYASNREKSYNMVNQLGKSNQYAILCHGYTLYPIAHPHGVADESGGGMELSL